MSFVTHRTKKQMWAYESTEGTDPIGTAYEFGKHTVSWGDFPMSKYNLSAQYVGARDPSIRVNKIEPSSSLAFAPVNGLPFYWLFSGGTEAAGVRTLVAVDSGSQELLTQRFQTENATENIRKSMVGAKSKNLNFTVSNINERVKIPTVIGTGFQGINVITPNNTGDVTPIFPDTEENMYYVDSNFELDWDSGGDVIDYAQESTEFKYICDTSNTFLPIQETLAPATVAEGKRVHIIMWEILRGADTSIFDDFLAQDRDSTGKSIKLKIYNSASNYIQLTFNNTFIETCKMNDANQAKGEAETYVVTAFAETVTPVIRDGLTQATFYPNLV